eukprot:IDg12755t1
MPVQAEPFRKISWETTKRETVSLAREKTRHDGRIRAREDALAFVEPMHIGGASTCSICRTVSEHPKRRSGGASSIAVLHALRFIGAGVVALHFNTPAVLAFAVSVAIPSRSISLNSLHGSTRHCIHERPGHAHQQLSRRRVTQWRLCHRRSSATPRIRRRPENAACAVCAAPRLACRRAAPRRRPRRASPRAMRSEHGWRTSWSRTPAGRHPIPRPSPSATCTTL